MHLEKFLHNLLSDAMHLKRLSSLSLVVEASYESKYISLTQLGRNMNNNAQERSNIRRVDRLLCNRNLLREINGAYNAVSKRLIGNQSQPIIVVDWSKLPHSNYVVLRASLVAHGRSLTLYDSVHPDSEEATYKVHMQFLNTLYGMIPRKSKPIVVTDAGFRNPWFEAVRALGWDYVGRIRGEGNKTYRTEGESEWRLIKELFNETRTRAICHGDVVLCKSNPHKTVLYSLKKRNKGRHSLTQSGRKRQGRMQIEQSQGASEPWLLASSLPQIKGVAQKVISIYKKRMQIEESFRDMKSSQYGFGLREVTVIRVERYKVYLLIIMLATLWGWLLGWAAENEGLQSHFQANSTKKRRVLSLFYLGCRIAKKKIPITMAQIIQAITFVREYSYV